MSKAIAIDYGTKRVGIAETDDLQIIASRLITVHSSELIEYLQKYMISNEVDAIVVGKPVNMKMEATNSSEAVNNFIVHLRKKFKNINIVELDERFTSKIAKDTILKAGIKKKKRKSKNYVDEISAVILLQDYLKRKEMGML